MASRRQKHYMGDVLQHGLCKAFHSRSHGEELRSILTACVVFPQHHHIDSLVPAETAECFGPRLFFLPLALEHQHALEMRKDLCFRSFSEELLLGQGQLLSATVDATTNKSL